MKHSVYLHIPFCTHRCAYCDFNTYAAQEHLIPAYVEALCREVQLVGSRAPRGLTAHTVFFGGGTPSLLRPECVRQVLDALRGSLALEEGAEITLEANPGTVTIGSLRALRGTGVNRISLGVQSANGEELRMLERTHSYADVLEAVSAARAAGFENLNLDLMYGLPEQAMQTWQTTVKRVLSLQPEHISAYALTLEHGTPFGSWTRRGQLAAPDPDLAADMYEWLSEQLRSEGYQQYEISNWARAGRECAHNLQYWRSGPYLGFGAGAHGYTGGCRYSNTLGIKDYLGRMATVGSRRNGNPEAMPGVAVPEAEGERERRDFPCSPAAVSLHRQTSEDYMSDFMIMGLRLTREGVGVNAFRDRFGTTLQSRYGKQLHRLVQLGLLEFEGDENPGGAPPDVGQREAPRLAVRLTQRARLLGNQVFMQFLGEPTAA
jgi:oxygen-independent coproporphyrinogen-3 oxidase